MERPPVFLFSSCEPFMSRHCTALKSTIQRRIVAAFSAGVARKFEYIGPPGRVT